MMQICLNNYFYNFWVSRVSLFYHRSKFEGYNVKERYGHQIQKPNATSQKA